MSSSQRTRDRYVPSPAAREASDLFNALPECERLKLAPLLEHYRQLGLAEARYRLEGAMGLIDSRIRDIRSPAGHQRAGTSGKALR